MSSPLKKRATIDTDTRSDGSPSPSETEAAPTVSVASTRQQKRTPTDKRIIQNEESCPLTWSGNDSAFGSFCSMDDEANRCVSVGRMIQERNRLQKIACNISIYRSREKGYFSGCVPEDVNAEEAEKALRKDGSVNDVFQFTAKGESLGYYFWSVSCQYKKRLTQRRLEALLLAGLLLSMVTCLCCNGSGRRVVIGIALSLRPPVK